MCCVGPVVAPLLPLSVGIPHAPSDAVFSRLDPTDFVMFSACLSFKSFNSVLRPRP